MDISSINSTESFSRNCIYARNKSYLPLSIRKISNNITTTFEEDIYYTFENDPNKRTFYFLNYYL